MRTLYKRTELQKKLLAYMVSVADGDVAFVNREELGAAVSRDRSTVSRTLMIMRRRGDIEFVATKVGQHGGTTIRLISTGHA